MGKGLTAQEAIARSTRKLREARFFLGHMQQTEARAETGPYPEPDIFQYYLSAFQAAAKSVIDTLCAGSCGAIVSEWRLSLDRGEQWLVDFMKDERDSELHRSGTREQASWDIVPLAEIREPRYFAYGYHFTAHNRLTLMTTPGTAPYVDGVGIRRHSYKLDGLDDRVTNASERYVTLLGRLVDMVQESTTRTV